MIKKGAPCQMKGHGYKDFREVSSPDPYYFLPIPHFSTLPLCTWREHNNGEDIGVKFFALWRTKVSRLWSMIQRNLRNLIGKH